MLAPPEPTVELIPEAQVRRIERRLADLVETCSRFSEDIIRDAGWNGDSVGLFDPVAANVEISRSVFGKWSLDILTLLHERQSAGFQEIRRGLGLISSRVLSSKLTRMQDAGLIRRKVQPTRPPRVSYSLTEHGTMVVKLGGPVFLYLRVRSALASGASTTR